MRIVNELDQKWMSERRVRGTENSWKRNATEIVETHRLTACPQYIRQNDCVERFHLITETNDISQMKRVLILRTTNAIRCCGDCDYLNCVKPPAVYNYISIGLTLQQYLHIFNFPIFNLIPDYLHVHDTLSIYAQAHIGLKVFVSYKYANQIRYRYEFQYWHSGYGKTTNGAIESRGCWCWCCCLIYAREENSSNYRQINWI